MAPRTDGTRVRSNARLLAAVLLVALAAAAAGVVAVGWVDLDASLGGSEPPGADESPRAAENATTEPTGTESADRPAETGTTRSSYTILSGTRNATEVYVIESGEPGPTALVVGGMHGDEHSGHLAARDVADWKIDAGTLVVIPAANRPALDRDSRKAFGSDVNDQFPVGAEPNTTLARAIWGVVERHDPDVVLDLHSSSGIYGVHDGRVGQAVFPTVTGSAVADADAVVEHMNREHVPASKPNHTFQRGNALTGVGHSLIRKVAGDRNATTGLIVEVTEYETTLDTRVRWTKAIVEEVLKRHGIVRQRPSPGDSGTASANASAVAPKSSFESRATDG